MPNTSSSHRKAILPRCLEEFAFVVSDFGYAQPHSHRACCRYHISCQQQWSQILSVVTPGPHPGARCNCVLRHGGPPLMPDCSPAPEGGSSYQLAATAHPTWHFREITLRCSHVCDRSWLWPLSAYVIALPPPPRRKISPGWAAASRWCGAGQRLHCFDCTTFSLLCWGAYSQLRAPLQAKRVGLHGRTWEGLRYVLYLLCKRTVHPETTSWLSEK